ncbi:hypothetical protein M758_10G184200 [Ceratodon purpureus]|nr:hypothetical protein M758_10G184200 [Ceratodon purpureus]
MNDSALSLSVSVSVCVSVSLCVSCLYESVSVGVCLLPSSVPQAGRQDGLRNHVFVPGISLGLTSLRPSPSLSLSFSLDASQRPLAHWALFRTSCWPCCHTTGCTWALRPTQ